ncbi:MAG: polysaccharide biosynthesis protein [Frankiales bacterium]|nr:polysaccharide biosynthesis protein [Frankiales bacterium]
MDGTTRARGLVGAAALVALGIGTAQVATYALNLVGARRLGPEGFGALASLLGVVAIGNVVALGLQAVTARRVVVALPADRGGVAAACVRVALPAAAGVAVAVVVVWPVLASVLHLDSALDLVLVALTLVPLTVTGAWLGVAQGHETPGLLAAAYFLGGVTKSLGGIVGALVTGTVTGTLVGLVIGSAAGLLLLWVLLRRQAAGPRAPLPGVRAELLHASHALLALFALTNVDLLLARHFLDPASAGVYAAGGIVVKVAFWLPQAILVLAFPGMADARRRRAMLVGAGAILALGAALVLGTALLPRLVVAVVGGSQYEALVPVVPLFALLGALQSLAQFLLYSRLAVEDRSAVLALWAAVVALVAVVWFGPHDSVRAIVLSAVAVVGLLCVTGALLARSELRRPPAVAPAVPPAPTG